MEDSHTKTDYALGQKKSINKSPKEDILDLQSHRARNQPLKDGKTKNKGRQ